MYKIDNVYGEYGTTLFNIKIEDIYGENCLENTPQYAKEELVNCFQERIKIINNVCRDLEDFNVNLSVAMHKDKIEFEVSTDDINNETLKKTQTTTAKFYQSGEVIINNPKEFVYKFKDLKKEVDRFLQQKEIRAAQEKIKSIFIGYGQEPQKLLFLQRKKETPKKGLKISFK